MQMFIVATEFVSFFYNKDLAEFLNISKNANSTLLLDFSKRNSADTMAGRPPFC
jgi:hypothetical protein